MVLELGGTVGGLVLFGIASPDTYRTTMWQIGSDNGFNSSPSQILYAYANYRPLPKTPMVWSSFITNFNVVVSVLSMFLLLVKLILYVMHCWYPVMSVIVNVIIVTLWSVSVYGQAGPDHSDPAHPSSVAWYITKSCNYAKPLGAYNYCQQAKGAFAVTVFMLFLFTFNLALGIWSAIPSSRAREARKMEVDDLQGDSPVSDASERRWEMTKVPRTPTTAKQPFTPRTLAFNTLDRKLPLRERYQ